MKEAWYDKLDNHSKKAWKVLVLDTGGGSLVHLDTNFTLFCMLHLIRPLFLPPYHTKAEVRCKDGWSNDPVCIGCPSVSSGIERSIRSA